MTAGFRKSRDRLVPSSTQVSFAQQEWRSQERLFRRPPPPHILSVLLVNQKGLGVSSKTVQAMMWCLHHIPGHACNEQPQTLSPKPKTFQGTRSLFCLNLTPVFPTASAFRKGLAGRAMHSFTSSLRLLFWHSLHCTLCYYPKKSANTRPKINIGPGVFGV